MLAPPPDPPAYHPAALAPASADPAAGALLAGPAVTCAWRGLPWLHADDVAFAGAGVELARTGQLTGSYIGGFLRELGTGESFTSSRSCRLTLFW